MNKSIAVILAAVFSFLSIPMLAYADKNPPSGTPHVLGAIQEQVTEINGKIDDLDSDDDNPLLADILAEIQGTAVTWHPCIWVARPYTECSKAKVW